MLLPSSLDLRSASHALGVKETHLDEDPDLHLGIHLISLMDTQVMHIVMHLCILGTKSAVPAVACSHLTLGPSDGGTQGAPNQSLE